MKREELPRREFWKKIGGIGGAIIAAYVVSKYLPQNAPIKEINIRLKAMPKVDRHIENK